MENLHDVGGQLSGSISKVDRELSWWEKRADAIILYLVEKRIVLLDELRCATEELEPVEYERLRHYERNIIILEKLLVEKGFLSRTMLDRKFNERRAQERGFSASPRHQVHRTHTHEHASDHGTSEYEWRIDAIQEILVQEGICTVDDIHRGVEDMDARGEALGGRIVAKAWTDPVFTRRLLADAKAAISELNIDTGTLTTLVALQNTERLHHLVVCTLCSCYPRAILGIPPDWYKSKALPCACRQGPAWRAPGIRSLPGRTHGGPRCRQHSRDSILRNSDPTSGNGRDVGRRASRSRISRQPDRCCPSAATQEGWLQNHHRAVVMTRWR
jgi:hypothetical protein